MLIANQDGAFCRDIELLSIEDARAFVLMQSNAYAAFLRGKFVGNVSPFEASSWPLKLSEAKTYSQTQNPADAPMLAYESSIRGVDLSAMVQKVLGNAQQLAGLEATIAGINGKHNDAIKMLSTIEEVQNYDWRGGYPEVT